MKYLETFLKNQKKFGKLAEFEVFHKKKPKVIVLVNEKGQYYIYFESKEYGFYQEKLIETSVSELDQFRNTDVNFNDIFLGAVYSLEIYKTHCEIQTTDSKVNELYFHSSDYYITTYKYLQEYNYSMKTHKKTSVFMNISMLLFFGCYAALLIPIKWVSYSVFGFLLISALILMYISFYKIVIIKRKNNVFEGEDSEQ